MRVVLTGPPPVAPFPFATLELESLDLRVCGSPDDDAWQAPADLVVRIGDEAWLTPARLAPGQWVLDARPLWFDTVADDAARFTALGQRYLDCVPVGGGASGVIAGAPALLAAATPLAPLLGSLWPVGEAGAAHLLFALWEAVQHRWLRQMVVWQANGPIPTPQSWAAMLAEEGQTLQFAQGVCALWLVRHPAADDFVGALAREVVQVAAMWQEATQGVAAAASRTRFC